MTASQIAEIAAWSDADMLAIAYTESAGGDLRKALQAAAEDILAIEAKVKTISSLVSFGYVRGAVAAGRS